MGENTGKSTEKLQNATVSNEETTKSTKLSTEKSKNVTYSIDETFETIKNVDKSNITPTKSA